MSGEDAGSTPYVEMAGNDDAIRLALLADSMDGVMDHAKARALERGTLVPLFSSGYPHSVEMIDTWVVGLSQGPGRRLWNSSGLVLSKRFWF